MTYKPEYRSLPAPKEHEGFWVLVARMPNGLIHELSDHGFKTEQEAWEYAKAVNRA